MRQQIFQASFYVIILLFTCPAACHSQLQKTDDFTTRKAALETNHDRASYDSLHVLLTRQYTALTAEQRKSLRATLEKHAIWPYETLCPETEPGTHITIHGTVVDEKQRPVPGARLHIFHTDYRGYYTPLDSASGHMMESDARLNGFLTADSLGRFEIRTVRPANYPKQYEGRIIPQHVHMNVEAKGFPEALFQVVFEDDPSMLTDYWKEWARKGKNPVVHLNYGATGVDGAAVLTLQH